MQLMPIDSAARPTRVACPARRQCRNTERGAVLVELAMVTPLLIMLIMGIVDYAVVFNDAIGLSGGVREATWDGGRGIFGAPVTPGCALTFGAGAPDENTKRIMCTAKRRSGLPPSDVRVMVRMVDLDNHANPGSYDNGQALMVCAMRKASSTTGFFSSFFANSYQRSRLTSVILAIDPAVTSVTGGAEDPLPGAAGGWRFCDPDQPTPN